MRHTSLVLLALLALGLSGCGDLSPSLAPTPQAPREAPPPPTPESPLIDTPILEDRSLTSTAAPAVVQVAVVEKEHIPTPQPEQRSVPVRVVAPAIGMDLPLVAVGLDAETRPIVPKHDAAWYNQSAAPREGENIVLWGHALRFRDTPEIPSPFGRLKDLDIGNQILLYDAAGEAFAYTVTRQIWATPDQVEYILPQGREQVTLVSCIGDKIVTERGVDMTHRLITIAEPSELTEQG